MSQAPPADDRLPEVGSSKPAHQSPRKSGSRVFVLIGLFAVLIGGIGFMYWKKNHDEKVTNDVVSALQARGLDITFSNGNPQETAIPLFQSMASTKVIRIGSGKSHVTDDVLKQLTAVNLDMNLDLDNCPITDVGLANLKGKRNVRWLKLLGTKVTNDGLKYLQGMDLEILDLSQTQVDDQGLATLAQFDFPHLKDLAVAGTKVTDKGIQPLTRFHELEWLTLSETKVTKKGRQQLKAELPDVSVVGVK